MATSAHFDSPSLSGILIVLNVVLALVWVPVLDKVQDAAYIFHALLFVNGLAISWWIWMNTSLHAHMRTLCRLTVPEQASALKQIDPSHLKGTVETNSVSASLDNTGSEHVKLLTSSVTADEPRGHDSSRPMTSPGLGHEFPSSRASAYPSAGATSSRIANTILDTPPSPVAMRDPQLVEAMHILRDLQAITKERDMYRTRAYELAMRLDECYSSNAQTESALERAESDAKETRRSFNELQAEQRELTIALSAALSAARPTDTLPSPPAHSETAQRMPMSRAQSTRSVRDDPATSGTSRALEASPPDERPLLLPPTSETSEDTPTRSRTVTWSSAGRSKSRLESIMLATRRYAQGCEDGASTSPGAEWDARRAASARPIFSIVHEGISGERKGEALEEGPLTKAQQEKEDILEDLRMSRPCSPPSTSPVHDSAEDTSARSTAAGEQRAEVTIVVELADIIQKIERAHRRQNSDTLFVPVLRQPRGPPPSPHSTILAKACVQTAVQRGVIPGHTWRGRSKASDLDGTSATVTLAVPGVLDSETASVAPSVFDAQSYPESRMPNRMRARQTTAPPTSMGAPPHGASSSTIPAVVIPPKAATVENVLGAGAIAAREDHRRRHATFGAGSASGQGQDCGQTRSTMYGKGPLQPFPFAPSALLYQTVAAGGFQQAAQ